MRQDQTSPIRGRAEAGPPAGSDAATRKGEARGAAARTPATTRWVDTVFTKMERRDAKDLARAEREARGKGKEPFSYARLTELLGEEPPDFEPQMRLQYYVRHSELRMLAAFAEKLCELRSWDGAPPLPVPATPPPGNTARRSDPMTAAATGLPGWLPAAARAGGAKPQGGEPVASQALPPGGEDLPVDSAIREALQSIADQEANTSDGTELSQQAGKVEILAAAGDPSHQTVHFLFDTLVSHWAQSGSDWDDHTVYHGTAVFDDGVLIDVALEVARNRQIVEYQVANYDRSGAVGGVRAELRARLARNP